MKNLLLVFFSSTLLIVACNDEKKSELVISNGKINLLLPTSIPVGNLFDFETSNELNWQKELNSTDFIKKVFDNVLSSEISVLNSNSDSLNCTKDEIFSGMDALSEPLNLNEIKSIYFEEEWSLDTAEPFLFEKNIINWYPVRYYKKDNEELKKLIFKVKQGNATELLAKNVISEFQLQDTIQPSFTENIDALKLITLIIKKATSGKIKLWDPLNTEKELTIDEVDRNMGQAIDTVYLDDPQTGEQITKIIKKAIVLEEITSMVFVEDWYYDPKTFAIKKVITGLGPVRSYSKNEGETVKKIVFMMFLGNEKPKIL